MLARFLRPLVTAAVALLLASPAAAVTILAEDFDGYTSFPSQNPSGDPVNPGLPKVSEGADQTWYGVRFEQTGCTGTCSAEGTASGIDADLFVQKHGDSFNGQGPGNQTHVGRFEDDAGIILQVSTVGYTSVTLDFDWRTFSTTTGDQVKVGYIVRNNPISFTSFNGGGYLDARSNGPNTSLRWTMWNQLMADGQQGTFEHETFSLPIGAAYLYVAFWMDDGEGDHGKLDNVVLSATAVPEPAAALLLLAPLAWLAVRRTA